MSSKLPLPLQTLALRLLMRGSEIKADIRSRLGRIHPSAAEVERVMGDFGNHDPVETARRIARVRARRKHIDKSNAWIDRRSIYPLVHWENSQPIEEMHREKRPAIIYFHHAGAFEAMGPAVSKLAMPTLFVAKGKVINPAPFVSYLLIGDTTAAERAKGMMAIRKHFKKGGMIVIAVEGPGDDDCIQIECLNRRIPVKRGIASLARICKVPVIPVHSFSHQHSGRLTFTAESPIDVLDFPEDAEGFDRAMCEEIMRRFGEYVEKNPGEVSWLLFKRLEKALETTRESGGNGANPE